MPRKKWREEELLPKVLELREKGMSYREIAKELGCSVFTVSKVLSSRGPRPGLEQVAELAKKVEEISKKVEEVSKRLEGSAREVGERLSKLDKRVSGLEEELWDCMSTLETSARRRLKDELQCKHVDEEGFCNFWFWHARIEGWEMKEVSVGGKKRYYLNVRRHPLVCLGCPTYERVGGWR